MSVAAGASTVALHKADKKWGASYCKIYCSEHIFLFIFIFFYLKNISKEHRSCNPHPTLANCRSGLSNNVSVFCSGRRERKLQSILVSWFKKSAKYDNYSRIPIATNRVANHETRKQEETTQTDTVPVECYQNNGCWSITLYTPSSEIPWNMPIWDNSYNPPILAPG